MESAVGSSSSYSYSLQITVLSAETLIMTGKKPVRKNTMVFVYAEDEYRQGYDSQQQQRQHQQHTCSSKNEGGNPTWDETLELSIPMHTKYITLEVCCASRSKEKGTSIAAARVPVSDFIGNSYNDSNDCLHFLSYRLRDRFGVPNGIINFSVKVLKGFGKIHQPTQAYMNNTSTSKIEGWSPYNKRENCAHGTASTWVGVNGCGNSSNIVVGVPIILPHCFGCHS